MSTSVQTHAKSPSLNTKARRAGSPTSSTLSTLVLRHPLLPHHGREATQASIAAPTANRKKASHPNSRPKRIAASADRAAATYSIIDLYRASPNFMRFIIPKPGERTHLPRAGSVSLGRGQEGHVRAPQFLSALVDGALDAIAAVVPGHVQRHDAAATDDAVADGDRTAVG